MATTCAGEPRQANHAPRLRASGVAFEYDGNGRRTKLIHDLDLAPSGTQRNVLYAYNAWGALATVTNPLSNQHKLFYDLDSRLDSIAFPGGYELRRPLCCSLVNPTRRP